MLAAILLGVGASSLGAQARPLADTVALGAFVDGLLRTQMAQYRVPSAVVAIVEGDRVIYQAGYGFADLARRKPVDPATSLFHIGSTGKLFTWTAVMQLVEQGKLELDRDVNDYLGTFRIPATYPEPITLRHLLTHTAGFQEGLLGYFIGNDSVHIRSIEETISGHVPTRVRPPGQLASYSNYGASLAGLIVEKVSGEPFAEYIERHIYGPLGIRQATFREPVPASLRPDAVIGYSRVDGAFKAMPSEIDGGFVPSGGTVMAAEAMTRFMIAHLQDGRLGDSTILSPATARLMHGRAFGHDPRLPGMALGFVEERYRGHRIIGHSGDSQYFHVDMALVPDRQLGIFVGYGGEESTMAREAFKAAFFERYLEPIDTTPLPPAPVTGVEPYLGAFRPIRMNYTDIDKLIYLVAVPPITVAALDSGAILVSGAIEPDWVPTRFEPAGEHLFRQVGGERLIAFRVEGGRATHLFSEPTVAAERVPLLDARSLWFPALGLAGVILLSGLIDAPYRRGRASTPESRRLFRTSLLVAGWPIATLIAAAAVVLVYQMAILERIPTALKLVLAMPVLYLGITAWFGWLVIAAWRRRSESPGRLAHLSLIALAAVTLCWFCWQGNLLGWQFG